jgi:glucokinase-like ROK family protein
MLISKDKLIEERESIPVAKGRPMKALYFGNNERYIIGIDLGTTYIRGMLTNMSAESVKEIEVVTESHREPEYVMDKVIDVIRRLSDTSLVRKDQILGIGMAVAGIIDLRKGMVVYSPAFNWRNVELYNYMKSRVNMPIYFDNVSRVMALGELTFGKGSEFDNMICINIGYGIGAGIIINRRIFLGNDGIAGEFGHIPVQGDNLIRCPCGKRNCLTAHSSGDAITQRVRLLMEEQSSEILMRLCQNNPENLTTKLIAEAVRLKDQTATSVFRESVYILGSSIAGLINIFNPQAIFIGGGVALNGDVFWDPLIETIRDNVIEPLLNKYQVFPVSYNDRASLYGAISLVINEVLNIDM